MSLTSIFLLWLVTVPPFSLSANAQNQPSSLSKGFRLSCGSSKEQKVGALKYISDENFIWVGNTTTLQAPGLLPILSTLRFFPDKSARKYCFTFPVFKEARYLVRTTYYYGDFDGKKEPPVFDQIIEGTKWSIVNTTEDFAKGLSSYYEIVVEATGKRLSVCIARNENTTSDPFISALELQYLDDSIYNSTDYKKYALSTVARNSFGDENMISFPDDEFNRMWQPYRDENPIVTCSANVTPENFWNKPPAKAFTSAVTTNEVNTLEFMWPPMELPSSRYYVALYFQDDREPREDSWRVFSVDINEQHFYQDVNVSTNGVAVYAAEWPLSEQTKITLTPADDMSYGPVISAAEILQNLPLGGRTITKDVLVMEDLANTLSNTPSDWEGDPCLPPENSWTGIKCSKERLARVISLNLTSFGLSGYIPDSIANLTVLQHLWLGGNQITGSIPNLSTLAELETLHLEDNKLEGKIPQSLSKLEKLNEIFLQNNNLDGSIPAGLENRQGLNFQVTPGNRLSTA